MKKYFIISLLLLSALLLQGRPRCDRMRPLENIAYPEYELTRADSATGFDILHYDISMAIDDQENYLTGTVVTTILAESEMSEMIFELEELEVDNVLVNGNLADYTHEAGLIIIELDEISVDETFTTTVSYYGFPAICPQPYPLGMFFSESGIFTISDPNASRYWWPCYDHPWDKAVVDLQITIRDDWEVASNGIRDEIEVHDDGTRTHHWSGSNPMATYLVSIVAREFSELHDMYEEIPIHNFVYPSHETAALEDFSNLPLMMATFSQLFGEYPFEKYGNAVTNFTTYGAMEHQTMTTLSSYMIDGNHSYEEIIAHELAHQWFGNSLTCLTWKDIWLSEGFATYSEALYVEQWQGYAEMLEYVQQSIQNYYKNWAGNTAYTTYDPPYSNIFNPSTYEKPASVLHMLRLITGDEIFFEILQTYYQTFQHGNVITEDFIQVAQEVSGQDLQQFFQQWIYQPGLPKIDYAYFISNDPNTPQMLTYAQTSCANANTEFEIIAPIKVNYAASYDSLQIVAAPQITETISMLSSVNYQSIEFDPDSWILNRGYTYQQSQINNAFASDESVLIFWDEAWSELEVDGYNLYRSESESGAFEQINQELITANYYDDLQVENDQTYFYRLKAVKNEIYESPFSAPFEATPTSFSLDQGILVVDESRGGNGQPGNPDDATIEQFYEDIIEPDFTLVDYDLEADLSLEFLANYSTIIWHDDDINFKNIPDNLNNLGSYLAAGGNLVISGWKTAATIDDYFLNAFLAADSVNLVPEFIFNQANSDIYPTLQVDPEKVNAAFAGCLAYITTFAESENSIYTFQSAEGSEHDGASIALQAQPNGEFIFLGFPLYFMQQAQASQLMNSILSQLGELSSQPEIAPLPEINLQAYPNPFFISNTRNLVNISYTLPAGSETLLTIFNSKGQKVKTIFQGYQPAGQYTKTWDGLDENNLAVSSGVYFYKLSADQISEMNKMIIVK
ncbi:MAG: M1 family aminopeptidase [Candidatus Cloacimonadales bacterium]